MKLITIGRHPSNDIVINDNKVSRHHLQLLQEDSGNYRLVDFGSMNGTFVNGKKVAGEMYISPKDIIRIGNTTLPWEYYFLEKVKHTSPEKEPEKNEEPVIVKRKEEDFFSTRGRIRRSTYLLRYFLLSVLPIIAAIIAFYALYLEIFFGNYEVLIIIGIIMSFTSILSIIQMVKRLHDVNKSGAFLLFMLIPIAIPILGIYLVFADGTFGPNQYGPDPKNRKLYQ